MIPAHQGSSAFKQEKEKNPVLQIQATFKHKSHKKTTGMGMGTSRHTRIGWNHLPFNFIGSHHGHIVFGDWSNAVVLGGRKSLTVLRVMRLPPAGHRTTRTGYN